MRYAGAVGGRGASRIQPCDGGWTAGFRGRPGMAAGSRDGRAVRAAGCEKVFPEQRSSTRCDRPG